MIDISITELVKSFDLEKRILDGVSLQIDSGERVGLLGKNGAGKTTLFNILTGALDYDSGEVPRGERYELCRSVHAEANAIISAARRDMVGGTIYLVGRDARTGALLADATSCPMCRRQIINAGLTHVVIRRTPTEFDVVDVQRWVDEDDSLVERV